MSPENWQQVKSLLDDCLDRPTALRLAYLESVCPDAEIRSEVISLLEAHEESEGFMDVTPELGHKAAVAFQPNLMAGQRVGPYYLIEEIGRGGMGTVYRAVRADYEFVLVVAIKIVSRGMDTEAVLTRFRNERQILASLDHPYVGRLLDGGTTETGLPYFVMEYVEGKSILQYSDEQKLSVSERILLFRKVCEAVSYAHRNLIVHRDIKPSNILVTPEGTPKLLDFGIAKIVAGGTDDDEITATLARMATPAYASPEQIRGGMVGTTSDVYSLGVILYELLTGHSPYKLVSGSQTEIEKIICEREPTRASAVVANTQSVEDENYTEPSVISEQRSTTVDGLRRKLRGELDNILSKALRKEPERRYQSVDQFSDDLRRHQEGLPISARKDSIAYRAFKFVGRHRVGVALGSAAVLALMCTTGYAVWKAHQMSRRIAEDHRLASAFLVDIHDSIARLPGATPAREALLERALKYLNGLARDAGDDPALDRALAMAYEKFADLEAGTAGAGLGKETTALEMCLKAQLIRERLAAAVPTDRQLQFELANNYLLAAFLVGRTRTAEKRAEFDRKAMAIADDLVKADPADPAYRGLRSRSELSLAYGFAFTGRWEEARTHLRNALATREKVIATTGESAKSRQELARIYYRFGVNYVQSGHPNEALDYLRKALLIQNALATEQTEDALLLSEIAAAHHFTGVALGNLGQLKEALAHFDKAIAIRLDTLAKDPRDARSRAMLAGNYAERARVQLRGGDAAGALQMTWKAIELQEALYAVDPNAVPSRISLADFYARLGSVQAALAERERKPAQKLARQKAAAAAYRRSDDLYDSLRTDGHLKAPDVVADADRVRAIAERFRKSLPVN